MLCGESGTTACTWLQVLYSLPELDGAIDTVPLGGLVSDDIFLIPERVKRLSARINKWVALRRKRAAERKVAVLLYGFPPGVGATGTAALLNVPRSLERMLQALRDEVRPHAELHLASACNISTPEKTEQMMHVPDHTPHLPSNVTVHAGCVYAYESCTDRPAFVLLTCLYVHAARTQERCW